MKIDFNLKKINENLSSIFVSIFENSFGFQRKTMLHCIPDLPRDYCPYTLSSLRTAAEDPGQPVWTCHSAELAMAFYEYLTILCNGIFRSLKILFVLFLYLSMAIILRVYIHFDHYFNNNKRISLFFDLFLHHL